MVKPKLRLDFKTIVMRRKRKGSTRTMELRKDDDDDDAISVVK